MRWRTKQRIARFTVLSLLIVMCIWLMRNKERITAGEFSRPRVLYPTAGDSGESWLFNLFSHPVKENEAYCTFLHTRDGDLAAEDEDFDGLRQLLWQLMQDKQTRDNRRDVVVMVTDDIPSWRLDILRNDGAIIRVVEDVDFELPASSKSIRSADLDPYWATKVKVWELDQYKRVLYLEPDTILLQPHPFTALWSGREWKTRPMLGDDGYGGEYLFSAKSTANSDTGSTFHTGLYLLAPSRAIFVRIIGFLNDLKIYGESNVLHQVFAKDGQMPWVPMATDMADNVARRSVDRSTPNKKVHIAKVRQRYLEFGRNLTSASATVLSRREGYL